MILCWKKFAILLIGILLSWSAQARITVVLTPDQCVSFVGPVYELNLQEQLGKGHSVVFPPTPQLSRNIKRAFIEWLVVLAKSGHGLRPLNHAHAFLTACTTEPVGTFVIAGDLI